jgi:hypothetical protein
MVMGDENIELEIMKAMKSPFPKVERDINLIPKPLFLMVVMLWFTKSSVLPG